MANIKQCPECHGTGKTDGQTCDTCQGSGYVDYQYFVYACQVSLTATGTVGSPGANSSGIIGIDTDANFLWHQIMHKKTGDAFVQVTEPTKGNRNWMSVVSGTNQAVLSTGIHFDDWAGTAQLPAYLYVPYLLRRQNKLQFNCADSSGSTNAVEIALAGFKLFPVPRPQSAGPLPKAA